MACGEGKPGRGDSVTWLTEAEYKFTGDPSQDVLFSQIRTKADPYLDRVSRDIRIRLVFPNRDLELKPQMYANIRLSTRSVRPVLVIPGSAVIHSGERNVVFVALEGGRFEPREVTLGMEGEGGYVQTTDGVRAGERVVTSAQFLIDSESRLQEAIQKMLDHRMMH